MIITTTPSVEGKRIVNYYGIVFGEVITGVNVIKDFAAGLSNFFGGRSATYEEELMNARHQDELADPNYTYLDVALCRKGIGGDDSWQAPVHPEFHLPAGEPRKLTFILSVIK